MNTIKLKIVALVNLITRLLHKVDPNPIKIIDDIVGDIERKVDALGKAQYALAVDRVNKLDLISILESEAYDLEVQAQRAERVKNSMNRILEG